MTLEEFGQSIKQKYPQYQQYSDTEIGQKMLEKYPVYQNQITSATTTAQAPTPSVAPTAQPQEQENMPSWLSRIAGVAGRVLEVPQSLTALPAALISAGRGDPTWLKRYADIPKEIGQGWKEGFWEESQIPTAGKIATEQFGSGLGSSIASGVLDVATDPTNIAGAIFGKGAKIGSQLKKFNKLDDTLKSTNTTISTLKNTLQSQAKNTKELIDLKPVISGLNDEMVKLVKTGGSLSQIKQYQKQIDTLQNLGKDGKATLEDILKQKSLLDSAVAKSSKSPTFSAGVKSANEIAEAQKTTANLLREVAKSYPEIAKTSEQISELATFKSKLKDAITKSTDTRRNIKLKKEELIPFSKKSLGYQTMKQTENISNLVKKSEPITSNVPTSWRGILSSVARKSIAPINSLERAIPTSLTAGKFLNAAKRKSTTK